MAVHSTPFERTLGLHIGAAATAVARDLAGLEKFLAEAAELEAAAGLRVGSQHTLHQLALFGNHQRDLRSVSSYYRTTAATLRGHKNAVGMALCYRSLREILLALGKIPETLRYWTIAEQALRMGQCPEADQLSGWIAALSDDPEGGQ